MESLLSFAFRYPGQASAVVPYFSPNLLPNRIVAMYSSTLDLTSTVGSSCAKLFLAKFDISKWLSSRPMLSERSRLLEVIANGLVACGVNPSERELDLFQFHSINFKCLLKHQFPDHFAESLRMILINCKKQKLSPLCLSYFNDIVVTKVDSKNLLYHLQCNELKEVIDWLIVFFLDVRINAPITLMNADSQSIISCNSFYDAWSIYLNPLSVFFENVFAAFISKAVKEQINSITFETVWSCLNNFFEPWICVNKSSEATTLTCPWNSSNSTSGLKMTLLFLTLSQLLLSELQDKSLLQQEAIINLLWDFYFTNSSNAPNLILDIYHKAFVNVQWSLFKPDLSIMESMISIPHTLGRKSLSFVGKVCCAIDWSAAIERAKSNLNIDDFVRLHELLLQILVLYSLDKDTLANTSNEMIKLLQTVEDYDWHLINLQTYNNAVQLLHNYCSSADILDESSNIHLTTRLMRIVAGFYKDTSYESYHESSEKRVAYVRCIVKLLYTCTMKDVMPSNKYDQAIVSLLSIVEMTSGVSATQSDIAWELTTLLSEFLRLFNHCSSTNEYVTRFSEQVLEFMSKCRYLDMQLACITAATQTLASVPLMVRIVESLIEAYFKQLRIGIDSGNDLTGGWSLVYKHLIVPELNLDEFITQCLQQYALLTLYGYILQQLPLCQNIQDERLRLEIMTNWNGNTKAT